MASLSTPSRPVRRGSSFSTPTSTSKAPQFRSKFAVSYEVLLSGEHPWVLTPGSTGSTSLAGTPSVSSPSGSGSSYFSPSGKKPSAPRTKFYADLLCLKVDSKIIEQLLGSISARQLTSDDELSKGARIRENIGSLWRECLRVWTDVPSSEEASSIGQVNPSDEVRRVNAIDTLISLSRSILSKNFAHSSSSLDLIWVFAGGIDEADDVFEDLVSAIDEGIRGELDNINFTRRTSRPTRLPSSLDQNASLHHQQRVASLNKAQDLPTLAQLLFHRIRAVQCAIIWISHASSTNLSAYFVRRDLFVGACSLLTSVQSILRSATQTPSGQRLLADEDAELMRVVVRDTTLLIGLLAGLGQAGSGSGTGVGAGVSAMETTTSPYFRRMCDWVDGGSMGLVRDTMSVELEHAWQAYEPDDANAYQRTVQGSASITSSLGAMTEGLRKFSVGGVNDQTNLDPSLPSLLSSGLLPLYLLFRANQVFVEVLLKPNEAQVSSRQTNEDGREERQEEHSKASFAATMISLSSYLATHASSNERSKSYARLALLIHLTLLSTPTGISALLSTERGTDAKAIRLCTQRSAPLPVRSTLAPSAEQQGSTLNSFFAQLNPLAGSSRSSYVERKRLLPFLLDTCVQYMRHNLRKRLDTSGYLICLQVVLLAIHTCADRRVLLEYSEWPNVWATVTSTIAFLVGRHTELRGVEVGKLGQGLLNILSLAVLESDRFLASRHDVNILVYEVVRTSSSLRRMAYIASFGKDPAEFDDGTLREIGFDKASERTIAVSLPMWRLLDLTIASFFEKLREWSEKKSSRGTFGFAGLSVSSLSAALLNRSVSATSSTSSATQGAGSNESGSRPSSSQGPGTPNGRSLNASAWTGRMPDVHTVLEIISLMDFDRLIHLYNMDSERGSGRGGYASPSAHHNSQSTPTSASSGTFSNLRQSSMSNARRTTFIDEEWLERAESQCLAEAFRVASEDMRNLISDDNQV